MLKNLPASGGDTRASDSIPGSGRSPGVGNGSPLQYSCLEDATDRGAWRVTKSWMWLSTYTSWYLINNVVIVSDVQQTDSIIHWHVSILFQNVFTFRLLHNIEQSFLCYTVGHCWFSILNFVVCVYQSQTPKLSLPPPWFPSGNHKFIL